MGKNLRIGDTVLQNINIITITTEDETLSTWIPIEDASGTNAVITRDGDTLIFSPDGDVIITAQKTIYEDGVYDPEDENLDGYSLVTVDTSGAIGDLDGYMFRNGILYIYGTETGATLIQKSITQNDTYNANDDNADGYDTVIVNVSGGGGGTIYGSNAIGGGGGKAATSFDIRNCDLRYGSDAREQTT